MTELLHQDLIKEVERDDDIEREIQELLGGEGSDFLEKIYADSIKNFEVGSILSGLIIDVSKDNVLVDVGYKSEGIIGSREFDNIEDLDVGDEIEVLLEAVEDDSGMVVLSKRKADRIRGWERIISDHEEGDQVTGKVIRKIKGGLLVDIGVPVFLPASQVSIRRLGNIDDLMGQSIDAKIIKIDEARRNIVISRRKLIEESRNELKEQLLKDIEVGQVRKGIVKNITDFGAFVDLGGIDGLLHITDMSWGRVNHPTEIVSFDDELEVVILNFDKENEKISLGLKQKSESPWDNAKDKYAVGTRHDGEVVNLMSYGAFVKLQDGIEGLVHISEMSWTRRINHPSECVQIGDIVNVIVLGINLEKQEISLGIKQTESNPWDSVEERYPPGTKVAGRVRNLTNYGAFVELEEGIDGLLHVSDISWTKKVTHPTELLKKGQVIDAVILSVDKERKRIALGIKQLEEDPWDSTIPDSYRVGQIVKGKATKITNFGVFVELQSGLEGLLHISEMADHKVMNPEDIIQYGEEIEVKVIKLDPRDRKIGLSLRRVGMDEPDHMDEPGPAEREPRSYSTQSAPQEEIQPQEEEQVSEEPVSEEPVSEEQVSEEPVSEEPVSEEPVSEDQPSDPVVASEVQLEETEEQENSQADE